MAALSSTALRTRLFGGARTSLARLPLRVVTGALVLLVVLVVLASGWAWFRQSSFAAVREITITGLSTSEAPRVDAALRAAARDMTTLAVREDDLRAAVARHPSVAGLTVRPDFPHALRVHVHERRPVALVTAGDAAVPVAADGRVLSSVEPDGRLPFVTTRRLPMDRLAERRALEAVSVMAVAPPALHDRIRTAELDGRGIVLDLFGGPDLIFGEPARPRAKWAAAARVLAEPDAAGAVYLDLRVPERVAAGGVGPVDPATADTTGTLAPADADPTLDSQVEPETSPAAIPLAQVQAD